MIDLKPAAVAKLQSIMDEKKLTGYGLRVYVAGSSCSGVQYGLGFDKKREDDNVETVLGMQVLVDPTSAQLLDGSSVDYIDEEEGGGFRIENPNQVGGCSSCGSGGHCH
jgi:iron-sulfur cluster insertion protein